MMTLMDMLMQQRGAPGAPDYTLDSARGFQGPSGLPRQAMLKMAPQAAPSAQRPPMPVNPPMPPQRPLMPPQPVGSPMQLPSAAQPGFLERMFSGPGYQSNSMPAMMQTQGPTPGGAPMAPQINWGDPNSAADFFRADRAMMQTPGLLGYGG